MPRLVGQPDCATCFRIHGTAETLRAADFPSEADWLERWVDRHENDPPPTTRWMTDAERDVLQRLPPRLLIDFRLIYHGRVPEPPGTALPGTPGTSPPDDWDPETGANLFVHVYLLPSKGIYILENLALERLARDRRWVFAFVEVPLKFRGVTGSPIRPLALV